MGISGQRGGVGSGAGHRRGFAARALLGALILASIVAVGACASYANVPEPDSPASITSPNRRHPKAVMAASLLRVVRMDPPGSARFAVALPAGVNEETASEILGVLGPGAELATAANADLPTYSIGRIWIRSGKSKVDVFRPVVELGHRDDGTFDRQAITVWLEGGIEPWRVTRTQRWEVGAFPRPYVEAQPGESSELLVPDEFEGDEFEGDEAPADDADAPGEVPVPAAEEAVEEPAPPTTSDDGVIRIESVGPGR